MTNTPTPDLGRVITSAFARKIIYGAYIVLLVVAGAVTVGFAALGGELPAAVIVANSVLGYLGIPIGGLAIANTVTEKPAPDVIH